MVEEQEQRGAIYLPTHPIPDESGGITGGRGEGLVTCKTKGAVWGVVGGRPAVRDNGRPRAKVGTFGFGFQGVKGRA